MEALVVLTIFVVLAALAARFGHDSREGPRSKEHDLARYGVTWESAAPDDRPAGHIGRGVWVHHLSRITRVGARMFPSRDRPHQGTL